MKEWHELHVSGHRHLDNQGVQILDTVVLYAPSPRVITGTDWNKLYAGISQRHRAIHCFGADVYRRQLILKDGVILWHEIEESALLQSDLQGPLPPDHCWCLISGLDLIGCSRQGWRR